MRQLKAEGWIHHLARHSTACFLTRGQCYISWERGMEVYDGMFVVLADRDVATWRLGSGLRAGDRRGS
jgi:deoxyribodipyrimidine photolyase